MKTANLGAYEDIGDDSVIHSAYPHLEISLPITPGTAYPAGTILEVDTATQVLEGSTLASRVYITTKPVAADDELALVLALGAVRREKLLKSTGAVPTLEEVLTIMNISPIVIL